MCIGVLDLLCPVHTVRTELSLYGSVISPLANIVIATDAAHLLAILWICQALPEDHHAYSVLCVAFRPNRQVKPATLLRALNASRRCGKQGKRVTVCQDPPETFSSWRIWRSYAVTAMMAASLTWGSNGQLRWYCLVTTWGSVRVVCRLVPD